MRHNAHARPGLTRNQNRAAQARGVQDLHKQVLHLNRLADDPHLREAVARLYPLDAADSHFIQTPLQIAEHLLDQRLPDRFDLGVENVKSAGAHQVHESARARKAPEAEQ